MTEHALEAEQQTHSAFKSQVEDMALAELHRLEADEHALQAELHNVRAEMRAVRSVLGSVLPPKPKAKPDPQKPRKQPTLSPHRRQEITEWLRGKEDEFGHEDVMAALGWAGSQVTLALTTLRDEGFIRLAGMGGRTGKKKLFRSEIY